MTFDAKEGEKKEKKCWIDGQTITVSFVQSLRTKSHRRNLTETLSRRLEKCGTSPGRTTDLGSGVSGLNV